MNIDESRFRAIAAQDCALSIESSIAQTSLFPDWSDNCSPNEMRDKECLNNGFTRNQSRVAPQITSARSKLSALELKVFYQTTTILRMADESLKDYCVTLEHFARALGISLDGGKNKKELIDVLRKIAKQGFEVWNQKDSEWEYYPIFSFVKLKQNLVYFGFNGAIKAFILQLKQFTRIEQVKVIHTLKSKYAIRIYALLKDYRTLYYRDFDIQFLIDAFNLPKSYRDYGYIKQKVLDVAAHEINAKTDLEILDIYPIRKTGKKVETVRILFTDDVEKRGDEIALILSENYKKLGLKVFEGLPLESERISFAALSADKSALELWNQAENFELIKRFSLSQYRGELTNAAHALIDEIAPIIAQQALRARRILVSVESWQHKIERIKYFCNFLNYLKQK